MTLGISSQKVLEVRHAQHVQMSIFANWFANCFAVNNISLTKGARPQVRHAQHVAAGDHLDFGAPVMKRAVTCRVIRQCMQTCCAA